MKQFGEDGKGVSQLNNTHYEHTILVSNSVLSKIELFTLTALTTFLYLGCYRDAVSVGDNLKIVGVVLYLLILAGLLLKVFCGVKLVPTKSLELFKKLKEWSNVFGCDGLQTTTVYHSKFKSSKFIPWHSISDVVINEAIVMQKVIFYLAVLVKGEENKGTGSIIPIFIVSVLVVFQGFKGIMRKCREEFRPNAFVLKVVSLFVKKIASVIYEQFNGEYFNTLVSFNNNLTLRA